MLGMRIGMLVALMLSPRMPALLLKHRALKLWPHAAPCGPMRTSPESL